MILSHSRGAGVRSGARFAVLAAALLSALPAQADDKADVMRMRAERLAAAGECLEAVEVLRELTSRAPDDAAAWHLAGQCHLRERQYVEALDALERARAIDPEREGLELDRGVALFHVGDLDAAREALEEAQRQGGGDPARLDLYLGLVLLQQAETQEAALALERARRAGPERVDPIASYYAGLAWQSVDERERAEEALQRVIDMDPDGPWGTEAARILATRRGSREGRPWFTGQVGLEFDSNVSLNGEDVENPSGISDDKDGRGVWYFEGGAELFRSGGWSGGVLGAYAGNGHFDLNDFDTHYPSVGAWLDYQFTPSTRARLRGDTGYVWVDYDDFLYTGQLTASLLHSWGRPGETEIFLTGVGNDYLEGLDNNQKELDRDGGALRTGLRHFYAPFEDWVLRGGLAYERYWATDGTEYDYDSYEAFIGSTLDVGWGVEWDAYASFEYQPFKSKSICFNSGTFTVVDDQGEEQPVSFEAGCDDDANRDSTVVGAPVGNRLDKTTKAVTGFSRNLTDAIVASVAYSFTHVESDRDVFDYDRHIVGVYLTYRFF